MIHFINVLNGNITPFIEETQRKVLKKKLHSTRGVHFPALLSKQQSKTIRLTVVFNGVKTKTSLIKRGS